MPTRNSKSVGLFAVGSGRLDETSTFGTRCTYIHPKFPGLAADSRYVKRVADIRQRSWFASVNRTAEELADSGKIPAKFRDLLPTEELKRICRNNDLPTTATRWLHTTGLTLFLAYQRAQPRALAEIRKELRDLIRDFQQLSKAIGRLDFEIEWELDLYVQEVDANTSQPTFYRTANPHLELFKQNLDELLERARAVKFPTSESGRRKALPTLALDLLASHLQEARSHSSRHDLARLAKDLFDPILLKAELPLPRWRQHALTIGPTTPGGA
jgi:hypothetical protein